MSIRLFVIAGLLLTAGCAHREGALPTCDGSDRRPANPHGSVLAGAPMSPPAAAAPETGMGGCA
jgi:hypothetical protein